ncbi:MAG: N-acetylmuramic acid 6-phosphate etherase [Erysipelotrichaceae bacterium]|nr:N-acetylmuramic acid 6-phosphate etherase [Erysipelotrichaceae bacterium]
MVKTGKLITEQVNENTKNIDKVSTVEMLQLINNEDKKIAEAIEKVIFKIAEAVDCITTRYIKGGRIIYLGAGSSGRLGVLDAVELTPTYNVSPDRVFGIIAGGSDAMYRAIEGAEDSKELAKEDLKKHNLTVNDTVIGIAASGRTPYTIAGLEYANEIGALSIAITSNENCKMNEIAQIPIPIIVGPEAITGSTRMKSGTSHKMVLNMISTGVMIKTGKVYQNYMINVLATNEKLVDRSIRILSNITNLSEQEAISLFEKSEQNVALGLIMHEANTNLTVSKQALSDNDNSVYKAIESLKKI